MKNVIESFDPQGGRHCITNALKQVFSYYAHPMSEEMMFGLASGISFLYLNQAASPMVSGRTKVFEFEEKLAQRLNILVKCKTHRNDRTIFNITKQMIDDDQPVLVYVDMPYLSYLGMPKSSHFGGHAVVIFGYDESTETFYVSDRDHHDFAINIPSGASSKDFHLVGYDEMRRARSSSHRPFPAGNKYLTFDFTNDREVTKEMLQEAIRDTCESMLHPPAQLLGSNGILKFSKEIKKWKYFDQEKLRLAGTTNYFQIHQDGGTGGGIFRKMYGDFLKEASVLLQVAQVDKIGSEFIAVSILWDHVAQDLWNLSIDADCERLEKMSLDILSIYHIEKRLYESLLDLLFSM